MMYGNECHMREEACNKQMEILVTSKDNCEGRLVLPCDSSCYNAVLKISFLHNSKRLW